MVLRSEILVNKNVLPTQEQALAGRENLDNLIFVINCNLQRLDGPVRGNGRTRSKAWRPVPTTMWSSRSSSKSWRHG